MCFLWHFGSPYLKRTKTHILYKGINRKKNGWLQTAQQLSHVALFCVFAVWSGPAGCDKQSIFVPEKRGDGIFRLRDGVLFHMYVSSSPCGDARLNCPYESTAACETRTLRWWWLWFCFLRFVRLTWSTVTFAPFLFCCGFISWWAVLCWSVTAVFSALILSVLICCTKPLTPAVSFIFKGKIRHKAL